MMSMPVSVFYKVCLGKFCVLSSSFMDNIRPNDECVRGGLALVYEPRGQ